MKTDNVTREHLDKRKRENKLFEMCSCGHMGGMSPNKNAHTTQFQKGHGGYLLCDCPQFTWVGWCNAKGRKI